MRIIDWSSDVCSSDLVPARSSGQARLLAEGAHGLKGILKIMRSKAATPAALSATALLLAACSREQPTAEPSGEPTTEATDTVTAVEVPSADASIAASSALASKLDMAALNERRDPERLLRFYTNAIRIGDWKDAARAWSLDAQMTPEKLAKEFGGDAGPQLAGGKGKYEEARVGEKGGRT